MKLNEKGFGAVEILIVIVVLTLIGFVGWRVYDSNQNTDENSNSVALQEEQSVVDTENSEVNSVEPEQEVTQETVMNETPATNISNELFSTGYRNDNSGILIDFLIGPGFSDYWVEYGQTPDALNSQTEKRSDGLGYAIESFGGFTAIIDPADLPDGDNIYFYRIAATKDGVVEYTGVSAFNYK